MDQVQPIQRWHQAGLLDGVLRSFTGWQAAHTKVRTLFKHTPPFHEGYTAKTLTNTRVSAQRSVACMHCWKNWLKFFIEVNYKSLLGDTLQRFLVLDPPQKNKKKLIISSYFITALSSYLPHKKSFLFLPFIFSINAYVHFYKKKNFKLFFLRTN